MENLGLSFPQYHNYVLYKSANYSMRMSTRIFGATRALWLTSALLNSWSGGSYSSGSCLMTEIKWWVLVKGMHTFDTNTSSPLGFDMGGKHVAQRRRTSRSQIGTSWVTERENRANACQHSWSHKVLRYCTILNLIKTLLRNLRVFLGSWIYEQWGEIDWGQPPGCGIERAPDSDSSRLDKQLSHNWNNV